MFEFTKTVEKIADVPKDYRGLYAEGDDKKFHLRSDDPAVTAAISAVMGLQTALGKERDITKDLKGKQINLSPLSEYGDNPDDIEAAVRAAIENAGKGKKSAEETQAAIRSAVEATGKKHSEEKITWGERESVLLGNLRSLLVTSEARAALAEAGAVKADLVLPFIERQVTVVEEGGRFYAQVMGDDGKTPRFNGSGAAPMSVADLVMEMKEQEDYGPFFKSDKPSGGGTPPGNRRTVVNPSGSENLSPTQKISQGLRDRK